MRTRLFIAAAIVATGLFVSATFWNAFPPNASLDLTPPLRALTPTERSSLSAKDFAPLVTAFRSQVYRSFCGPASLATVLRAYGVAQADQTTLFPTLGSKLDAFYTGMSLAELASLAQEVGLHSEIAYADTLSLDEFRTQLKQNLGREGDFVLVNYDRRVLKQSGRGHISPVAAYDEDRDAFLVLDEAAYKYPFTWIPTSLLYDAVHTRDGKRFRGVLFIRSYGASN